jgi:2-hydroxycyclohexanecarboxyl-CoA dehydrogenase
VVNNAGWDKFMPFFDTDERFWRRNVELNYIGVLRVTHAVLPGMIERGRGRVINISSDAARVGNAGEAVYSGAKGAVLSFSKTLAREVARSGITVNVVCPGLTRTPGIVAVLESAERSMLEELIKGIPAGRAGEPEDIAAAVVFLASREAGYITGQTLSVNGGLTMA